MEENSDAHMETDVSSTTDDVPESPQVTGSHGDIEMIVVVEELKEELDCSIDMESRTASPPTSTETSPQKQTPRNIIKSFNENDISQKLSDNYESHKNKISSMSVTTSPVKQLPEPSDSFKKAEPTISPGKIIEKTVEKSPSKSIVMAVEKSPLKSVVKAVAKSPSKSIVEAVEETPLKSIGNAVEKSHVNNTENIVERSPIKNVQVQNVKTSMQPRLVANTIKLARVIENTLSNDVMVLNMPPISPAKDIQEKPVPEASLVNIANKEVKLPESISTTTENISGQKIISETLQSKASNLKGNSLKETKLQEKSPVEENQQTLSMDIDPIANASYETGKNQSQSAEDTVQESAAKVSSNQVCVLDISSIDKTTDSYNLIPTADGGDKMNQSVQNESLSEQNDSQQSLDTEIHNRSCSRELKSLIKSAKESKIINECTQLKSKTRKSRSHLDASNASPNTPEPDKVTHRRSSINSQVSNSSEKSDNTLKRSMRSQNPEFANKCKKFLNSVSSKVMKDSDEIMSDDEIKTGKSGTGLKHESTPSTPKRKKGSELVVLKDMGPNRKSRADGYCWRCHWTVDQDENDKTHPPLQCSMCPRSYHYKCLSTNERKTSPDPMWMCPDCVLVLQAESSDTRSPAMKKTSLGTLCDLLKYALERMMDLNGVEPFMHPVDRSAFPDYDKYVAHPMDLSQMKQNIVDGCYGSTEAFIADVQWILHNSIIFNTLQSKLTGGARALVRSCRAEMGEIEACPECYAAAHARRATWFTDVCTTPHVLLWAKLKGFPYWPAKGMSVNSSGLVDVRFFGAHDRAWVPAKDCFLFSEKDPNNFRSKRTDILDSIQEAEQHIRNISRKYGKFVYPPFKTPLDSCKLTEQLKMMIPSFEGEAITSLKEKPTIASPLSKVKRRRSTYKGSKSSLNDGDDSESEDMSTSARTEVIKVDKKTSERRNSVKSANVDSPVTSKLVAVEEPLVTRKRRRSNLEEASVMTVISTSQPVPEKKNKADKPEQQEPSSSKQENAHSTTKEADAEPTKKKTDIPKAKSKDEEPSSTQEEKEAQRVTPIKLVALPRPNKLTPKMFTATKAPSNPSSPRQEDTTPQKTKPKPDKTKDDKSKKHRSSRSNKSLNNTSTPKSAKTSEKKTENDPSAKEDKPKEKKTENEPIGKEQKPKEKKKETDDANKSTVDSSKTDTQKSMKDRLTFDDDTSLAVIARERRRSNANLPTISSVCSLSTIVHGSPTTYTPTTSFAQTEFTVRASSSSSIFTPTSTDTVLNMKDAVTKLQKLRDNTESVVGRVGVRAFARMTSPDPPADSVEVEIKAEPVDIEEDEVRLSEKMDLMNACKLQPVGQTASLRDVRISRVVGSPAVAKKPEAKPRARKTFPQPRPADARSELNGKNSMVYIPIQPPAAQAPPVRAARAPGTAAAGVVAPRLATATLRVNAPVAGNSALNTLITPIKPSTSISSPSVVSVPTVGQVSVPTVGQVPTTVHTVPLMTSVNGQWMFSLQPIMSVGGVDNGNSSPMLNGTAAQAIMPLPPSAAPAQINKPAALPVQANKPVVENSSAELSRLARSQDVAAPPSAGPLIGKIHQNAQKLSDIFRTLIEDTLEKSDDPSALATSLRMQLEQARWRHTQEVDELKHNHELTMSEMRVSFEKEKVRILTEARRASQAELEAAVKLAKCKQWCASCGQEAQFYCCWNTAYCDYPCQRTHWPQHFAHCAQRPKDGIGNETSTPESRLQVQPDKLPVLQKNSLNATRTVGGKVTRVFASSEQKASIIVSMVEDNSGNQTMKCVGTYKPGGAQQQISPLILNKQVMNEEAAKKVVTSGGYLIVGSGNNASVITPGPARRPNTIQYLS